MYNYVIRKFADMCEIKFYTCDIKSDEDRIKPRKQKSIREDKLLAYVYDNPFSGDEIIEYLDAPIDDDERLARSMYESYRRTRKSLFDLCMSNVWEYFVTFTFNEQCVDRYLYDDCADKMAVWLNNVRKKFAPDLKYLVVPEQHKDGAWHFHGLFANCGDMIFTDSGRVDKSGKIIYNLFQYKFGFTTATEILDNRACSMYIQKYMSKDMCGLLYNKKRYWASRNLKKPDVFKKRVRCDIKDIEKMLEEVEYKKHVMGGDYFDVYTYTIYTTNIPDLLQDECLRISNLSP